MLALGHPQLQLPKPSTVSNVMNPFRVNELSSWIQPVNQKGILHGLPLVRRTTIKCMAHPRRVKMVSKQIQREISDMLLNDEILRYSVLPEASLGADRYLSSLATITDVEVSRDLQVVKVYVSVFGDKRGKELAIAGLKSKAKYVRGQLGRRMKLRLTPEIRFIEDDSYERGSRVIAILDKLKEEAERDEAGGSDDSEDDEDSEEEEEDDDDDDDDWDDEEPDEKLIYVN